MIASKPKTPRAVSYCRVYGHGSTGDLQLYCGTPIDHRFNAFNVPKIGKSTGPTRHAESTMTRVAKATFFISGNFNGAAHMGPFLAEQKGEQRDRQQW